MTIPDGRGELLLCAADLSKKLLTMQEQLDLAYRINYVVLNAMFRRKGVPRTPPKSKTMNRKLAAQIRAHKLANPDLSEQEVAVALGVNAGRVSEAMIGKRK